MTTETIIVNMIPKNYPIDINRPELILSATGWVISTPKSIPTGKIETAANPTMKQEIADKGTLPDLRLKSKVIGVIAVNVDMI
jgi:hypothetical protein